MTDSDQTFSIVTSVDDPLTADRLVQLFSQADIDAFSRARGAASSASFEPTAKAFWELFVPTAQLERAQNMVTEAMAQLEAEADEAGLAAEEEALLGENPTSNV